MMRVTEVDGIAGYVTTIRAAKILKTNQMTVIRRIERGQLPATRLGERVFLIRLTDLAAYDPWAGMKQGGDA